MLPVGADLHHPHARLGVGVARALASLDQAGGVLQVLRGVVHVDDVQQGLGEEGGEAVRCPGQGVQSSLGGEEPTRGS